MFERSHNGKVSINYSHVPINHQFNIFITLSVFPQEMNPNKFESVKHHDMLGPSFEWTVGFHFIVWQSMPAHESLYLALHLIIQVSCFITKPSICSPFVLVFLYACDGISCHLLKQVFLQLIIYLNFLFIFLLLFIYNWAKKKLTWYEFEHTLKDATGIYSKLIQRANIVYALLVFWKVFQSARNDLLVSHIIK